MQDYPIFKDYEYTGNESFLINKIKIIKGGIDNLLFYIPEPHNREEIIILLKNSGISSVDNESNDQWITICGENETSTLLKAGKLLSDKKYMSEQLNYKISEVLFLVKNSLFSPKINFFTEVKDTSESIDELINRSPCHLSILAEEESITNIDGPRFSF